MAHGFDVEASDRPSLSQPDEASSPKPSANDNAVAGPSMPTYTATGDEPATQRETSARLFRRRHSHNQDPPAPSMAERLNRMRVEDRRRARNEQARNAAGSQAAQTNGKSSMRADAPSFLPSANIAGSASSRAGALYHTSAQLLRQESEEAQRNWAIRRKFAGPAPPSSWRANEDNPARNTHSGDGGDGEHLTKPHTKPISRYQVLTAARRFFPDADRPIVPKTQSLIDVSLCTICAYLCDPDDQSVRLQSLRADAHAMPVHLKERALAMSGRYARGLPLTEAALWSLFEKQGANENPEEVRGRGLDEDEEGGDDLLDAWDVESDTSAWPSHRSQCSTLDLSFASVSARAIRSLIRSPDIHASHLRALSLAGWGHGTDAVQGRTRKCLRTSSSLFSVLDQLTNLQVLSLASTKLLPDQEGACIHTSDKSDDGVLTADAASEALAFLKKLSRRTVRLKVLDLSACRWIDGAVIANAGWYSTNVPVRRLAWPQLEDLILTACSAFAQHADMTDGVTEQDYTLSESNNFAGSWHAAHHGNSRATNSPYFAAHKPGLGRALLAHGVGVWDLVSGRRSLVKREAEALAQHSGHTRSVQNLARQASARSAFDDDFDLQEERRRRPGPYPGYAISHGIAPYAGTRSRNVANPETLSSTNEPPRCPVSGGRVARHEWERARVLDAVRGRWGSAILGTIDDEGKGEGAFVTVYF